MDVDFYEFPPGGRELVQAFVAIKKFVALRHRDGGAEHRFDVVHAHFGLTAWPALAVRTRVRALTVHGTDVYIRRTRAATAMVLPLIELPAAVSDSMLRRMPGRAARARARVLPCGADLDRFAAHARVRARQELGLDPERPYMLFPADPTRASKRYDSAIALSRACGVELLVLGGVDPERVPLWINAANVVVAPFEREGFGLAVVEALACDVPVLATPVGIHAEALAGVAGTLCAPFDLAAWMSAAEPHLEAIDPRVAGRASAERFSAGAMAERVAAAWYEALERSGGRSG